MKFLIDQDAYAITIRFIRSLGHDVVTASELGLSKASDIDLLKKAEEQNRILVTRDRDFGAIVFVEKLGCGVIYLRMVPSTFEAVHQELEKILKKYSEAQLKKAFVVIDSKKHRFRRISAIT